jgi:hypothetical protein
MRAVMVKFSSLAAEHSLRPSLPHQRGPSWRGSCELTGLGDMKVDACDAACFMDHRISGHRNQSLSSYTFV